MKNSLLVDTNILVYAADKDSEFYRRARQLLFESDYSLITTSKNISEFLSVVTKGIKVPLSVPDALSTLEEILETFTILYPTNFTFITFQNLLRKYKPTGLRIHDYEIASIGISNGVTKVATVNTKDFIAIEEISLITL